MKDLNRILKKVEKPSRYIGGEFNAPEAQWKAFNYCICFPDVYEVGLSNLGIKIVAESLRSVEGVFVDRCFAPWKDFADELRSGGIFLYGLDSKRPLKDFDMVGFSLSYELSYTDVLYMLDLGGIPLRASERSESDPIIQGGGPCAFNPEPMSEFFDLFVIGDGEEIMAELAKLRLKTKGKSEFLREAAKLDGVYVPAFMTVKYGDNGVIEGFLPEKKIKKAVCRDLDRAIFPLRFEVGNIAAVFDRAVVEVMRGCPRGCRFCQAGFLYRPIRRRSVKTLTDQCISLIETSGYDEVSLNSLSTGDYPHLRELLRSLKEKLPNTAISLPSLRIDSFEGDFIEQSRKSSLTFAPEAGTQRLRDVINKDITEDEIRRTMATAFERGYTSIKLYFMMGLPTETDEDLKGIADIVYMIRDVYAQNKKAMRSLRVSVSVSTFIPKPFTPFQWARQITKEEFEHKIAYLKSLLFVKGVNFSWNDYELSMIEAVLARGDRRLCAAIERAYKSGCFLDGWAEFCDYDKWKKAFSDSGINIEDYTGKKDYDSVLPWDFIECFVDREYFVKEAKLAERGEVTGGCRNACKACGIQKNFRCDKCSL